MGIKSIQMSILFLSFFFLKDKSVEEETKQNKTFKKCLIVGAVYLEMEHIKQSKIRGRKKLREESPIPS